MVRRIALVVVWSGLLMSSLAPLASAQTPPDNSKVNKRDQSASQRTADQQSNTRTDVSITRDIRRAIVQDKSLSTYAHNVKIITQHGQVMLKGPVRTEEEKKAVEAKAADVAGADHVKSQVSVTNAQSKRAKGKA